MIKILGTENAAADREIVISRVINASRERVVEAFVDPKQVVQWWGPNGFGTTIEKMDFGVGSEWRHVMHGPDGTDYPNWSRFIEAEHDKVAKYATEGGKQTLGRLEYC